MYYFDKKIEDISSSKSECPICSYINKQTQWKETVSIEDEEGDLISAKVECTFYHCKRCGFFSREGDSDDPDFYESENRFGISIMKNPIKAIRQILALKKHTENLSLVRFFDYKEYEPKL